MKLTIDTDEGLVTNEKGDTIGRIIDTTYKRKWIDGLTTESTLTKETAFDFEIRLYENPRIISEFKDAT